MSIRASRIIGPGLVLLGVMAFSAQAQTIPDGALMLRQEVSARAEVVIALSPWTKEKGVSLNDVAGAVTTTSWQLPNGRLTSLDLSDLWQSELAAEGFSILFACTSPGCGGFDFRYALPTFPEPDMHVDLGEFRYIVLRRDAPEGAEHRVLLISRAPGLLFAQITSVLPTTQVPLVSPQVGASAVSVTGSPAPDAQPEPGTAGLVARLMGRGGAALDDLMFAPGAAALVPGDYASLDQLGQFLRANPTISVALVGHTDAVGSLSVNVALSQQRAESVRAWLLDRFDLPLSQIGAEGVGYLAPRASNADPEGQARNRRVEVIMTSARQ